ncbi:MAG TPA: hypothetical protein VF158_17765 [Longimicrobiales bacterium]
MWVAIAAAALLQVQVEVKFPGNPTSADPDSAGVAADSVRPPPDSATLATAYLDAGARVLVERARARRDSVDRTITRYEVVVREHISAGFRAFRRDRLVYRREAASRVRWHHLAPPVVEALGAREVIPIIQADARVPEDLPDFLPELVYDPADDRLMELGDGDFLRHPLADGSEWDYRFASGDTTRLRLPDGRTIRILELRLLPRRADPRLLRGALWIDSETFAVVQAFFRLARPFDLERDAALAGADGEDIDEIPGILKPVRAEVRYIAIEYGLWEMRWWLPRLIAFEGEVQLGPLLRMPLRYERVYSGYRVEGDTLGLPPLRLALAGAAPLRSCGDGVGCVCRDGRCRRVRVVVPEDTASLLHSELLPHSIFRQGEALVDASDLEEARALLDALPDAPAELEPPRFYWGLGRPGLVRYNRVEGLSLGARVEMAYGAYTADLTARLGTADLEPNAELGVGREALGQELRLAAYRRLNAVDADVRPFSIGNSLDALIRGDDDGDYFRSFGVELQGRRAAAGAVHYDWRLFVEHQSAAPAETGFSLRRFVDDDFRFRGDLPVDEADLVGGRLAVRVSRGLDPTGFRWDADLSIDAVTGTFRYARPAIGVRLGVPLPGPLIASFDAAAGTSYGTLPDQALWFVGGPSTVRGYDPLTGRGTAFWRGRGEVATAVPGARVALFSDIGWAGDRDAFGTGTPLLSAGIGVSALDGLLRLDLARALREPTGWKLHFYADASL